MRPISNNRYRLTHHSEEFDCPTCGAPVYIGDTAWDDDGDCYCSAHCAGADPRRRPALVVGALYRSGAGNLWRVLQLTDDRVQVQLAGDVPHAGATFWWHVSSTADLAPVQTA